MTDAFFQLDGDGYLPQVHATGPWSPEFLHGGPPCALMTRGFERALPDDFQITRITFDLLRPVGFARLTLRTEIEETGTNVRRGMAVLEADGKALIRGHAMAFRKQAIDVALPSEEPPQPPAGLPPFTFPFFSGPIGYHTAMDGCFARGNFGTSPVAAWLRMKIPLLPGEKPSPFVRVVCAADSGHGVAQVVDFKAFTFVNADLSLSFLRRPKGEWICLEAHTIVLQDGIGLCDTRLWDERGPIGRVGQGLIVRPRDAGL